MGLFDKLLKEGAGVLKDVTSDSNKEKAASLFQSLKDTLEEHADGLKDIAQELKEHAADAADQAEAPRAAEASFDTADDDRSCREKLLEVLKEEFPACTVRENVSPTEIGGTGRFMNYSMVVYAGDAPKLFLMIIGKTTTSHREYRWSREEAEKKGYTFLNFVEHYPNTKEYISQRLHKYL